MSSIAAPAPRERSVLATVFAFLRRQVLTVYSLLFFAYLLLPIAIVVVFSFNHPTGKFNYTWQGFTWDNWRYWDGVPGIRSAIVLSLEIAFVASLVATALGTMIALALVRYGFRGRGTTNILIFLPLSTPEIVLGASLLTLFLNLNVIFGFWTILIAHIMFCISFAVVTVKARLVGFDRHLEEAAMDLGANEWMTFQKVTLPLIAPAILAALSPLLRDLDRRLRRDVLQLGVEGDVPALRLGRRAGGSAAAGERDRDGDLRGRADGHARERPHPDLSLERSRMTAVSPGLSPAELQKAAREHLWLHFTQMGGYLDSEVPIIVRGEGCYLEDANGKRYLDALAGLFAVQIGYSYGDEVGEAAAAQMRELPFYTNWSYAHPRAIELAAEVASLAPGDLNRVFFVSGGSEAIESAWKLARQYYSARGEHRTALARIPADPGAPHVRVDFDAEQAAKLTGERRWKAISRNVAYHGTTMGRAVDQRDPRAPEPVRAARPRRAPRAEHQPLPPPDGGDRGAVHELPARRSGADDRGNGPGDGRDGDHGAGPERRRSVHAARGLLARRTRDLRSLRDPALRGRGDHGLRARRRVVRLRPLRHPPRPDHVREGPLVGLRLDRRGRRDRPCDGAVPRKLADVHARHHVWRAPRFRRQSR